jgi:hypothetical protein
VLKEKHNLMGSTHFPLMSKGRIVDRVAYKGRIADIVVDKGRIENRAADRGESFLLMCLDNRISVNEKWGYC